MTNPAVSSASARELACGQILKSARECFQRQGLRATTMEGIARAAGTSRQTVYKLFATRLDLVGAAVADRISELADDILARTWNDGSLWDAFVNRACAVVEDIRNDQELSVLLGDDSPMTLHQALWQPVVRQRGLSDWQPWLREARRAGFVRADVTDEDIYEWLQTVLTSIILRPDPDPAHQRALIETFLADSLRPPRQTK
jgi:AcrR family transcriptional regulator